MDRPAPASGDSTAPVSLEDYRLLARAGLPPELFDYIDGGAGDEVTRRANREDLDRLALLPFSLRDVSAPDASLEVLGRSLPFPLGFAPTAFHRLAHAEGEIATARAEREVGLPMIVSAMSSIAIEEVAAGSGHTDLWLQTYIFRDRQLTRDLLRRAECADYKAVVVTLGCPAPGKRDRNLRNRFVLPDGVTAANFGRSSGIDHNNPIHSVAGAELDPSLTWRDLDWLRTETALPVIAKGLMNPRDVDAAAKLGLDGIIVSNHGGRQLDTTASTIRVLPDIVEAAAGRLPVFVDGGFRRGTDLLKALALGADCVFLGRPVLWSLAAAGEAGVAAMTRLIADELVLAMQLAGCPTVAQARRDSPYLLRWT